MNNNYNIPFIYEEMDRRGYINYNSDTYLRLNDMEWMSIDAIKEYKYEKGESKRIIPFAISGGGDKWVWVVNESKSEYCVGFCANGEWNGIYYAPNTTLGIFRQIVEYVSDNNFYMDKTKAKSYQVSEEELQKQLLEWKDKLPGILNEEYIDVIDMLSKLHLKKVKCEYGEWYALLSLNEREKLIDKYMTFDLLNKEFECYIE